MNDDIYLGDSVYLKHDGIDWYICTNNGYADENVIILEPEVLNLLKQKLTTILP